MIVGQVDLDNSGEESGEVVGTARRPPVVVPVPEMDRGERDPRPVRLPERTPARRAHNEVRSGEVLRGRRDHHRVPRRGVRPDEAGESRPSPGRCEDAHERLTPPAVPPPPLPERASRREVDPSAPRVEWGLVRVPEEVRLSRPAARTDPSLAGDRDRDGQHVRLREDDDRRVTDDDVEPAQRRPSAPVADRPPRHALENGCPSAGPDSRPTVVAHRRGTPSRTPRDPFARPRDSHVPATVPQDTEPSRFVKTCTENDTASMRVSVTPTFWMNTDTVGSGIALSMTLWTGTV